MLRCPPGVGRVGKGGAAISAEPGSCDRDTAGRASCHAAMPCLPGLHCADALAWFGARFSGAQDTAHPTAASQGTVLVHRTEHVAMRDSAAQAQLMQHLTGRHAGQRKGIQPAKGSSHVRGDIAHLNIREAGIAGVLAMFFGSVEIRDHPATQQLGQQRLVRSGKRARGSQVLGDGKAAARPQRWCALAIEGCLHRGMAHAIERPDDIKAGIGERRAGEVGLLDGGGKRQASARQRCAVRAGLACWTGVMPTTVAPRCSASQMALPAITHRA